MAKSRDQKRVERKQQKAKIRALQYAASAARKAQKGHKVAVKRPVREVYSQAKANARLRIKQKEADSRQLDYESLSKGEKLILINARIDKLGGKSKRELDRVNKLK